MPFAVGLTSTTAVPETAKPRMLPVISTARSSPFGLIDFTSFGASFWITAYGMTADAVAGAR